MFQIVADVARNVVANVHQHAIHVKIVVRRGGRAAPGKISVRIVGAVRRSRQLPAFVRPAGPMAARALQRQLADLMRHALRVLHINDKFCALVLIIIRQHRMPCAVNPRTDDHRLAALHRAHQAIVVVLIGARLRRIRLAELQRVAGLDVILHTNAAPLAAAQRVVPAHQIQQVLPARKRRHIALLPQRCRQRHAEAEAIFAVALVQAVELVGNRRWIVANQVRVIIGRINVRKAPALGVFVGTFKRCLRERVAAAVHHAHRVGCARLQMLAAGERQPKHQLLRQHFHIRAFKFLAAACHRHAHILIAQRFIKNQRDPHAVAASGQPELVHCFILPAAKALIVELNPRAIHAHRFMGVGVIGHRGCLAQCACLAAIGAAHRVAVSGAMHRRGIHIVLGPSAHMGNRCIAAAAALAQDVKAIIDPLRVHFQRHIPCQRHTVGAARRSQVHRRHNRLCVVTFRWLRRAGAAIHRGLIQFAAAAVIGHQCLPLGFAAAIVNRRQSAAARKRRRVDRCDACRNRHRRQAVGILKHAHRNLRHA